jgi:hypothetical protein
MKDINEKLSELRRKIEVARDHAEGLALEQPFQSVDSGSFPLIRDVRDALNEILNRFDSD